MVTNAQPTLENRQRRAPRLLHQTINSTTLGRPQAAPIEAVAAGAQRGASNPDVLFKRKKYRFPR